MPKLTLRNKSIFMALLALMLVSFVCYHFYVDTKESLVEQVKADVKTVAYQNNVLMESEFKNKLDILSYLSSTIENEQQMIAKLEDFKDVVNVYGLKRIGILDTYGNSYTTDGFESNLSYREFFSESMKGNRHISKQVMDALGYPSLINILSVPIRSQKSGNVIGVLFATYDSERFRHIFDVSSFDGKGYCIIINNRGDIVVDSAQAPFVGKSNIFDEWKMLGKDLYKHSNTVLTDMQHGTIDIFEAYSGGVDKIVHYAPIKIGVRENYLYLLTVVPSNVLFERLSPVANNMRNMLFVVLLIGACLFGYISYNSYLKDIFLSRLAYQDELTKGPNYSAFKKCFERRNCHTGYIISIDIDHFTKLEKSVDSKIVNQVILNLWEHIYNGLMSRDFAARVNRDEFVVYTELQDLDTIIRMCEQGCKDILDLSVEMNLPVLHAVCGIYKLKEGDTVDIAYKHAYDIKFENKGNFDKNISVYNDEYVNLENERQYMEDHFLLAIEEEELEVWYQPKIRPRNSSLAGAEALVRWRSGDKLIPPGKFIPLFEKNGMIVTLDEYVFDKTCQQIVSWQKEGRCIVPISVNLSRASLCHSNIVDRYINIMNASGAPSQYIQIEITESAADARGDILKCMEEFHNAGIKLLLDDFGSGYSSMASLYKLPFNIIKIDKSLVDYVEEENGGKLIQQIIEYSKSIGKEVTVEGVETEKQAKLITDMNCDSIQGFYYSKPLNKEEFETKYL